MTRNMMNLSQLPKHMIARITGFDAINPELETRLREIGFAEGDMVSLQHKGLFGGNPISINLNGALIAMRKQDARIVLIAQIDENKSNLA